MLWYFVWIFCDSCCYNLFWICFALDNTFWYFLTLADIIYFGFLTKFCATLCRRFVILACVTLADILCVGSFSKLLRYFVSTFCDSCCNICFGSWMNVVILRVDASWFLRLWLLLNDFGYLMKCCDTSCGLFVIIADIFCFGSFSKLLWYFVCTFCDSFWHLLFRVFVVILCDICWYDHQVRAL